MKGPDDGSLDDRLEAMARENRWTRWVGTALFGGVAAFLTWHGLPSRSTVRIERLELRDRQGRLRAELALDPDLGVPRLMMYDQEGRDRFALAAHNECTTLSLEGPGGGRVGLSAPAIGLPGLELRTLDDRGAAAIVAGADGSLGLTLEGQGGLVQWTLRPDKQGRPALGEDFRPSPGADAGAPRRSGEGLR